MCEDIEKQGKSAGRENEEENKNCHHTLLYEKVTDGRMVTKI
jgi:hypothetical protein